MNDPRIGTSYDVMPELDSVAHVDFEEAPDVDDDDDDRRAWMVDAMQDVLNEAGVFVFTADCFMQLDMLGEELAWLWVERLINHAGFSTYNSDSYFEVYPPAEIDPGTARELDVIDELESIADDLASLSEAFDDEDNDIYRRLEDAVQVIQRGVAELRAGREVGA